MSKIINKKECNDLVPNTFIIQSSIINNTYTGYCPTKQEIINTGKFKINGIYSNNQLVQKNDVSTDYITKTYQLTFFAYERHYYEDENGNPVWDDAPKWNSIFELYLNNVKIGGPYTLVQTGWPYTLVVNETINFKSGDILSAKTKLYGDNIFNNCYKQYTLPYSSQLYFEYGN